MMEKGSVAKPWADFEVRRECAVRVGECQTHRAAGSHGVTVSSTGRWGWLWGWRRVREWNE